MSTGINYILMHVCRMHGKLLPTGSHIQLGGLKMSILRVSGDARGRQTWATVRFGDGSAARTSSFVMSPARVGVGVVVFGGTEGVIRRKQGSRLLSLG